MSCMHTVKYDYITPTHTCTSLSPSGLSNSSLFQFHALYLFFFSLTYHVQLVPSYAHECRANHGVLETNLWPHPLRMSLPITPQLWVDFISPSPYILEFWLTWSFTDKCSWCEFECNGQAMFRIQYFTAPPYPLALHASLFLFHKFLWRWSHPILFL